MDEDFLARYVNGPVLDSRVYEALRAGDTKTLLRNMLLEQISDPLLAAVMQSIVAENKKTSHQTAGQGAYAQPESSRTFDETVDNRSSDPMQVSAALETLNYVTRMLGACSICCGKVASCPECGGSGKPGKFPSIASTEEFRAWIEPALDRMGMHIADPPEPESSTK
jgi:hypothetical protein